MSLLFRIAVPIAAVLISASLAGCVGTTPPPSASAAGLANIDPCHLLTPQQLSADGLPTDGVPQTQLSFEPGCQFSGSTDLISFYKDQRQTVDSYQANGKWDSYQKITVNGRPAARAQSAGSKDTGICEILLDAGGGVVISKDMAPSRSDDQSCAVTLKYAQLIEPGLPK